MEYVKYGSNSELTPVGETNSRAVKKQEGDSTASKTPSLSSSMSKTSVKPSPSVLVHPLIDETNTNRLC